MEKERRLWSEQLEKTTLNKVHLLIQFTDSLFENKKHLNSQYTFYSPEIKFTLEQFS